MGQGQVTVLSPAVIGAGGSGNWEPYPYMVVRTLVVSGRLLWQREGILDGGVDRGDLRCAKFGETTGKTLLGNRSDRVEVDSASPWQSIPWTKRHLAGNTPDVCGNRRNGDEASDSIGGVAREE